MRPRARVYLVAVAAVAACQMPGSTTAPVVRGASSSDSTKAPTDTMHRSPLGPLVGRLTDGGNWIPKIGDASPEYLAYDVSTRYLFVDSTGRDTARVAQIDSAAYYNAPLPNDTAGSLGARYAPYDCPITPGTLLLECPPSATANHVGEYLVTVETASHVQGQFELYVYPP